MELKPYSARCLIAGGFADFLIFLTTLPNPIVVGKDYPRDRLLTAFQLWAKERDFNIDNADISAWRACCQKGFMKE